MQLISRYKVFFAAILMVSCQSSDKDSNILESEKEIIQPVNSSIKPGAGNICFDEDYLNYAKINADQCLSELSEIRFDIEDLQGMFRRIAASICSDSSYLENQNFTQADCLKDMVNLKDMCFKESSATMDGIEYIVANEILANCLMQKL